MPADLTSVLDAAQAEMDRVNYSADRLASARAEGVREGIEMAAKWHEARAAEHSRYATREASGQWTNGPALSEDAHRRYAETLRALSPPPAEPTGTMVKCPPRIVWTPTHRHYKGALYRELMRVEREGDCEPMVVYEAEDGRRWTRPATEFDGGIATTERDHEGSPIEAARFQRLNVAAEPTGMTAEPGAPVAEGE